jgi:hypothetical protein
LCKLCRAGRGVRVRRREDGTLAFGDEWRASGTGLAELTVVAVTEKGVNRRLVLGLVEVEDVDD